MKPRAPVSRGIELRANSIRFTFLPGKPTLMVNGSPIDPNKPANLKYAERIMAEIRQKIALGTYSEREYFGANGGAVGQILLGDWLETWIKTQRVAHSTLHGYRTAINFWIATLGQKPLRALRHSDILTVQAARPELSGKTIRNYTNILQQALALALRERLIDQDASVGLPRAKWQRKPPDPFSLEEAEAIISAHEKHSPEAIWNSIEWWFFSGPRTSEFAGLRWPNVDFAGRYVRISEALVSGEYKDETKTSVSRDVLQNSRSLAALNRQRKHTQIAGEHVWLDPVLDQPWIHESVFRRRHWTPILKRLGIRYRRPYNMRHTYATMLLMANRTDAWCAGQMGHSVEVFHSTYAKWIRGDQDKREMAGLEAWLTAANVSTEATR